ncbi:MAG: hypothetical protein M3R41_08885 [Pseudomonadota bacterium]|nr:hypothetical protein [Pseudomonadota bacterium]
MLLANKNLLMRAILIGGTIAGVIDVFAASIINHIGPGIILQAIASGVAGKAAFAGGGATMVLGLVLQICMSILIAAIFMVAATKIDLLRRPALWGALYGIGVYGVMTFVVVPLSQAHANYPATLAAALPDLVAMIVFGLIVAFTPGFLGRATLRGNG